MSRYKISEWLLLLVLSSIMVGGTYSMIVDLNLIPGSQTLRA